jgi:hypothetical protein
MLNPDERQTPAANDASTEELFVLLGGELAAVDLWTRVDFSWMDPESKRLRDAVGYRSMTMAYRVAGLTLGDADAAPSCPPFMIEIWPDRISAQVFWHRGYASSSRIGDTDAAALHHWAAGSLTKNLRIVRFADGDPGLEAELHIDASVSDDVVREFVSAFSWDVAALHAFEADATLLTTEEWVRRAALSISRSTPRIPLRDHPTHDWPAVESPRGVFCSLQPGGLCESDNVLYAVSSETAALIPITTLPGHRSEWDYSRLTDIWLAHDGVTCFARSLLLEGFVSGADGSWRAVNSDAITAVTPWGERGFLLGLHDGRVVPFDSATQLGARRRLTSVSGRFSHLVAAGQRAIGLIGTTLFGARLIDDGPGRLRVSEPWTTELVGDLSFDVVSGLDVDGWSSVPALAVLGDDGIAIVDVDTGAIRSQHPVELGRQIRWIGPGWLLVLDTIEHDGETQTRLRVLDVVSGRWTEPVMTAEVSRIAVRGEAIYVGYANQSIAVWSRANVCRGIGAWSFRSPVPEDHRSETREKPAADIPAVNPLTSHAD